MGSDKANSRNRRNFLAVLGTAAVFLAALVAVSGCGPSLAGTYVEGLVKHPWSLALENDGTYVCEQDYHAAETGRWWSIGDQVAVLLPDDPAKKQRFVTIEKDPFVQMFFSEDLRQLIDMGRARSLGQ